MPVRGLFRAYYFWYRLGDQAYIGKTGRVDTGHNLSIKRANIATFIAAQIYPLFIALSGQYHQFWLPIRVRNTSLSCKNIFPSLSMVIVKRLGLGRQSFSICFWQLNRNAQSPKTDAEIINISINTNITSTNGVTLISEFKTRWLRRPPYTIMATSGLRHSHG